MKKPKDVPELATRLIAAAATPLVEAPEPAQSKRRQAGSKSKAVLLRVPLDLYEKFDAEAVRRTKATGRGVTMQQVILAKLGDAE